MFEQAYQGGFVTAGMASAPTGGALVTVGVKPLCANADLCMRWAYQLVPLTHYNVRIRACRSQRCRRAAHTGLRAHTLIFAFADTTQAISHAGLTH